MDMHMSSAKPSGLWHFLMTAQSYTALTALANIERVEVTIGAGAGDNVDDAVKIIELIKPENAEPVPFP